MKIIFNGEPWQCNDGQTLQSFIEQQCLSDKRIAVELNFKVVPRSQLATVYLRDGDKVEIVHAIGGG